MFQDSNGNVVQTIKPNKLGIQNVAVAVASARTTNVVPGVGGAQGDFCMLISTTNCWFNWGSGSPDAAKDATSIYLPANTYFYLPIVGGVDKVAFIRDSADGTAQVIPAV